MNIVTIIFTLLANRVVLEKVFQLLAPILGELTSQTDVKPAEILCEYDTAWAQEALKQLIAPNLEVDGEWGPETEAAVRRFQAANPPLKVDGQCGIQTMATLELELGKIKY